MLRGAAEVARRRLRAAASDGQDPGHARLGPAGPATSTCTSTRRRTTPHRAQPFRKSRNNPPAPEVDRVPGALRHEKLPRLRRAVVPAAVSATVTASLVTGPTPTQSGDRQTRRTDVRQLHAAGRASPPHRQAHEPTMGVDLGTNKAYMLFNFDVLEAAFDDSTTPPRPPGATSAPAARRRPPIPS